MEARLEGTEGWWLKDGPGVRCSSPAAQCSPVPSLLPSLSAPEVPYQSGGSVPVL